MGAAALTLSALSGVAQTLSDANSTVSITTNGVANWVVDGSNIVNQQSYFYQVGTGGPPGPDLQIVSQSSSGSGASTTTMFNNTPGGPGSPSFSRAVTYTLTGGTPLSGSSILQETVKIINTGSVAFNFNFFQYSDFNVAGASTTLSTLHSLFNDATLTAGPINMQESIDGSLNPGAPLGELANDGTLLTKITGTPSGYQLANNASGGALSGSDNKYALEWQFGNVGVGSSKLIGETLNVTGVTPAPEPATWSLVAIGLILFGAARGFRRRNSQ